MSKHHEAASPQVIEVVKAEEEGEGGEEKKGTGCLTLIIVGLIMAVLLFFISATTYFSQNQTGSKVPWLPASIVMVLPLVFLSINIRKRSMMTKAIYLMVILLEVVAAGVFKLITDGLPIPDFSGGLTNITFTSKAIASSSPGILYLVTAGLGLVSLAATLINVLFNVESWGLHGEGDLGQEFDWRPWEIGAAYTWLVFWQLLVIHNWVFLVSLLRLTGMLKGVPAAP